MFSEVFNDAVIADIGRNRPELFIQNMLPHLSPSHLPTILAVLLSDPDTVSEKVRILFKNSIYNESSSPLFIKI